MKIIKFAQFGKCMAAKFLNRISENVQKLMWSNKLERTRLTKIMILRCFT